jgi:heptosyltransferase-1
MASHGNGQPRVLIIRLSSFGDVVLAEPVARHLKQGWPDGHLTFATYQQYAPLAGLFAGVNEVLALQRGAVSDLGIEARRFDVIVDLQNSLRSRQIAGRFKASRVLRYRRQYLKRFLCVYAPWLWRGQLRHTVDLYLDALRPLGIRTAASPPALAVPTDAVAAARARLGEGRVIAICPGGSSPHKLWGRRRFAALVRLLAVGSHRVVVVGSETDSEDVEGVAGEAGDCGASYVIESDIRAMAGLLSVCTVTVSSDSGLMHLAAAVGSRVVGIFGPTSPLLGFAPLAPGAVIVSRNAPCSPCSYHGNRPCRYDRTFCLEDIEPAEIRAIVDGVVHDGT